MDSVSLDRLDSSKGYIPGNVVLCRAIVNIMKSDLSEAEFSQTILALAPWAEKFPRASLRDYVSVSQGVPLPAFASAASVNSCTTNFKEQRC